jgi:hypothetical protein
MYVSSIHTSKYLEKRNTIFTITQTQEKLDVGVIVNNNVLHVVASLKSYKS